MRRKRKGHFISNHQAIDLMKGPTRSTSYWQWCNGIVERLKNSSGKRRRRADHQRGLERKKKSKIKKWSATSKQGGIIFD